MVIASAPMSVIVVVLGAIVWGLLVLVGVPLSGILDSIGMSLGGFLVVSGLVTFFGVATFFQWRKERGERRRVAAMRIQAEIEERRYRGGGEGNGKGQ